jgi:hypothetical protein
MQPFERVPSTRMEIASPIDGSRFAGARGIAGASRDLGLRSRASLPAPGRVQQIHLAHHGVRISDDPFSGGQSARTQRAADAIVVAAIRLPSTPRSLPAPVLHGSRDREAQLFSPDNSRIDGPAAQRGFVARKPARGTLVRPFCQFFLPIKCARVILHFGL